MSPQHTNIERQYLEHPESLEQKDVRRFAEEIDYKIDSIDRAKMIYYCSRNGLKEIPKNIEYFKRSQKIPNAVNVTEIKYPENSFPSKKTQKLSVKVVNSIFPYGEDFFSMEYDEPADVENNLYEEITGNKIELTDEEKAIREKNTLIAKKIQDAAISIYNTDASPKEHNTQVSKRLNLLKFVKNALVFGDRVIEINDGFKMQEVLDGNWIVNRDEDTSINYLIIKKRINLKKLNDEELKLAGYNNSQISIIKDDKIEIENITVDAYKSYNAVFFEDDTKNEEVKKFMPNDVTGMYEIWEEKLIINGREVRSKYTQSPRFILLPTNLEAGENYSYPFCHDFYNELNTLNEITTTIRKLNAISGMLLLATGEANNSQFITNFNTAIQKSGIGITIIPNSMETLEKGEFRQKIEQIKLEISDQYRELNIEKRELENKLSEYYANIGSSLPEKERTTASQVGHMVEDRKEEVTTITEVVAHHCQLPLIFALLEEVIEQQDELIRPQIRKAIYNSKIEIKTGISIFYKELRGRKKLEKIASVTAVFGERNNLDLEKSSTDIVMDLLPNEYPNHIKTQEQIKEEEKQRAFIEALVASQGNQPEGRPGLPQTGGAAQPALPDGGLGTVIGS